MKKFVAVINYIPNCPVHDPDSFSHLKFMDSFEEVRDYAISDPYSYKIVDIYNVETEANSEVPEVSYTYNSHSIATIKIEYGDRKEVYKPDEYKKDSWQLME